jgi:hypothetical protein
MVPFSRSRRKSVLKGVAMERREFLKMGTAAGLVSSAKMLERLAQAEQAGSCLNDLRPLCRWFSP